MLTKREIKAQILTASQNRLLEDIIRWESMRASNSGDPVMLAKFIADDGQVLTEVNRQLEKIAKGE